VNPALQVQAERVVLGLGELELLGHVIHVPSTVACELDEYFPAPQSVHAALPVLILYLPATQALQGPPSGPVNPALQVQAARVVLGLGELELLGHATHVPSTVACELVEYFPAPQSVHAALPVLILYLPATQALQGPPSGPVNPALQVQAARVVLGLGELESLGHATHVPSTVACELDEYFPAPQSVHAALPVLVLYLPATQAVHEPSGPVNPSLQLVCTGHVALQEEEIPEPKIE
jgi:hypothetical protein